MSQDKEIGRKAFFTEGPLSFLRAFLQGARESETRVRPSSLDGPVLRPPGAAPEAEFLSLCTASGACASACPADAILMLPDADDSSRLAPRIIPSDRACVICEDLACMKACPTGALTLVAREAIRIGRAVVDRESCLAWKDADAWCRYCIDHCPVGESAIRLERTEERRGPVIGDECVGCGVCEHHCPVYPGAVRVFPAAD